MTFIEGRPTATPDRRTAIGNRAFPAPRCSGSARGRGPSRRHGSPFPARFGSGRAGRQVVGAATGLAFSILLAGATGASAACTAAGKSYSSGGAACLPAVVGGTVRPVLHTCEGQTWRPGETVCPDEYAYFCAVGPHAVPVGTTMLLGTGPQRLECRFPGNLFLADAGADTGPGGAAAGPASRTVRRVQAFLEAHAGAGAPGPCGGEACSGLPDAATRAALAAFVADNAGNLMPFERERFGIEGAADPAGALLARSPIDVFPLFVEVFDVPDVN